MPTDDYWIDAGRPELFLRANLDLVTGRRRDRADGIHPEAKLGADVVLEDAVVGPGASVGAGAVVSRSVLLPGALCAPSKETAVKEAWAPV